MESTSNSSDSHKMDIKMEIKEEPIGTLPDVKCEYEDDFHSETVFVSADFVSDSSSNREMCNKIEIKEEPAWPELKPQMELPCAIDVDLRNEIKETAVHTNEVAVATTAEELKLYMWRNSSNLGEANDGHVDETSQRLKFSHLQILEESKANYNTVNVDIKDSMVQGSVRDAKKLYVCEICSKSFKYQKTLKRHKLIHEGKRPYTCEICNKSFTQVSSMKKHKLTTHEGKRPYECETCSKGFRDRHTLKRHKLIHEGKRPYTCEICNKSFNQISHMRTHKLIHEGKKPHTCEICNKSFKDLSTMKRHKLMHKNKRLYSCEICNLKCIHESYLDKHKLTHHSY